MRRLPLLLLLYVTLDFANPLMPGAVSFEAGSIEVVQGDRTARAARPAAAPACLVAEFPVWGVVRMEATLARAGLVALAALEPRAARRPACAAAALLRGAVSVGRPLRSALRVVPGLRRGIGRGARAISHPKERRDARSGKAGRALSSGPPCCWPRCR